MYTYIYDPLPDYSDVFAYLIGFDKNNIIHKETLNSLTRNINNMILHGNRMEVDYIQEFLNQNPTLLIDGNFEHIFG